MGSGVSWAAVAFTVLSGCLHLIVFSLWDLGLKLFGIYFFHLVFQSWAFHEDLMKKIVFLSQNHKTFIEKVFLHKKLTPANQLYTKSWYTTGFNIILPSVIIVAYVVRNVQGILCYIVLGVRILNKRCMTQLRHGFKFNV